MFAALLPVLCAAGAQDMRAIERTRLMEAMGLQPGHWTTIMVTESIELEPLPGRPPLPPQALAAARSQIGRPVTSEDCVALPAAAAGDLLLPGVRVGGGCRIELAEASQGRVRYRARCGDSGGGSDYSAETSGEGIYTPTSIEGRHSLIGSSPGAGVAIRSTMRLTSRRDGQCVAGSSPDD